MDSPLSVDQVRRQLAPHGLTVIELPADTSTAQLAANALGTTVATIVKSLVFMTDQGPILALVAGNRKLNARQLSRDLGLGKIRLATPDEVLAVAGYPTGGVPPLAHRNPLRTLLDSHLLEHETVYAAAGSGNAIFAVTPHKLRQITGAEVVEAAE